MSSDLDMYSDDFDSKEKTKLETIIQSTPEEQDEKLSGKFIYYIKL